MTTWQDFNDASPESNEPGAAPRASDELRAALLTRLESVLFTLYPAGKRAGGKFVIGDVLGSPGRSLEIVLDGEKAGLWIDRASDQGGDVFDLIAAHCRLDRVRDFPVLLDRISALLNQSPPTPRRRARDVVEDLGPATAKWDYYAADGTLLACVYRYDPPGGGKEFRPWDAKRRRLAPPEPRPLYHQPGIALAESVVLVEGEKCAQALIDAGFCATTAMHGASAPVDKTDWSPLAGKSVLIWPDKDKPGWEYAMRAASALLEAGASDCAVLLPPETQPEGWDAADGLAKGFDVAAFLSQGERIQVLGAVPEEAAVEDPIVQGWLTEDALAQAFTRRYAADWRYVAPWGQWLGWTGCRWQPEVTLCVPHLVRLVCRRFAIQADSLRLAAKLASSGTISGVERLVRSDREHAATVAEWDVDPWLLNTPGGVIDLRTGHRRAHARADRMTRVTTATPQGDCPTWRAFLHSVTGGDTELQAYLQRVAGYCLTGSTREHALFFFYGTGANGKSVFVNTLTTLLGNYATNAPMDTFMETRSDRHPTDMAGLRGARLVSSVETEQGRRWAESKLKALTGGDTISARFMRQDFFEFVPQFKLLVTGNHKPAIRNIDEAMRRRMHLIPFTVTIPPEQRDAELPKKLLAERHAILGWGVQGALEWLRHGLQPPARVRDATNEYFDEEDAIGELLTEECFFSAVARVSVADLYERWRQRTEKRGEYAGNSRWLVQQLLARGFTRVRMHGGVKALAGLSLKPRDNGSYLPYCDN